MSDSVHSDAVSQLNNHFILQFNMTLLTLRPLSEPHHSTLHLFICLTALQSLFSLSLLYLFISTLLNLKEKGDKPCVVCYILKWIKCDGCPLITSLRRIICWLYVVVNTGSWCQVMKNWLLSAICNNISMQVTCQKSLYTSFYFQWKNCFHPSKKHSPHIHIHTTWQI